MSTRVTTSNNILGPDEPDFFQVSNANTEVMDALEYAYKRAEEMAIATVPNEIEDGVPKYIYWMSELLKQPERFADIVYELWQLSNSQKDPFMDLFEPIKALPQENSMRWSIFKVDPTILPPTTRNVPVRLKTGVTEHGSAQMTYYARMLKGDFYAMLTPQGVKMFNMQMADLISSINGAIKLHIARYPLQITPCEYFQPDYINAGMTEPTTMEQCILNQRFYFNCFGKSDKTWEMIMSMASQPMERAGGIQVGGLIAPQCIVSTLMARRESFLYYYAGSNAESNLANSAVNVQKKNSLLGVNLIPIPLIESTRVNDGTSAILRTQACTGSFGIFGFKSIANGVENWRRGDDEMGMTCWTLDNWSYMSYGACVGKDLRFRMAMKKTGRNPDALCALGAVNRDLLLEFCGPMQQRVTDVNSHIERLRVSSLKVERHMAAINTENPSTPAQKRSVDPLVVHATVDDVDVYYPACFLGEISEELQDDDRYLLAYQSIVHVFMKEISEEDRKFWNSLDIEQIDFARTDADKRREIDEKMKTLLKFLRRFMLGNLAIYSEKGVNLRNLVTSNNKEVDDAVLPAYNLLDCLLEVNNAPFVFNDGIDRFEKYLDPHPRPIQNEDDFRLYNCEIYSRYETHKNVDFVQRWKQLENESVIVAAIGRMYLMQPITTHFFEYCSMSGIFIPFSGIVARFSEMSDVYTPVLTATGKIGVSMIHMFPQTSSMAGERKEFSTEMTTNVGAAITDSRRFFPLFGAVGGNIQPQQSGCGHLFITDLIYRNDQMDASEETLKSKFDGFFDEWRKTYLNNPLASGVNTNFFFFQGSKIINNHRKCIDITGRFRPASGYPNMIRSPDFETQKFQIYPGAAFNAYVLDAHIHFPDVSMTNPPKTFSVEQIAVCRRYNSVATMVETIQKNIRGVMEVTGGMHMRGERVPGTLDMDQAKRRTL